MQLCAHKHDKVCFERNDCPVCEVNNELKKARDTISQLEKEIDERDDIITNFKATE